MTGSTKCVFQSTKPSKTHSILLFSVLLTIVCASAALEANEMDDYSLKLGQFAVDVYGKLAQLKPNENIVFSPFSIQTCGAMARMGAEGETAAQLDRGLRLPNANDPTKVAQQFHEVLEKYKNSNVLKVANKIYVMQGYTVKRAYNELLTKQFFSKAEEINFALNTQAAKTMNNWVESKTNNLIKDLIPASALDQLTRLVLLNAIHFKDEWKHPFPKYATREDYFYLNKQDKVKVQMMTLKEHFRYADLPELDAQVLEMPYKNSDLSMLIILPNEATGLKAVEEKLSNMSLAEITAKMYNTQVIVKMPKFKAEFEVELSGVFKELGMARIFSDNAEFGGMLDTKEALQVSKVIHKAFIEVNEEGTEAAAATAFVVRKKRCLSHAKEFIVHHPFVYVISHATTEATQLPNAEYASDAGLPIFMGAVATFDGPRLSISEHEEL